MQRAEEKTRVNTSKLAEFERQHDEHEAGRKAAEVRCQENIQINNCLKDREIIDILNTP